MDLAVRLTHGTTRYIKYGGSDSTHTLHLHEHVLRETNPSLSPLVCGVPVHNLKIQHGTGHEDTHSVVPGDKTGHADAFWETAGVFHKYWQESNDVGKFSHFFTFFHCSKLTSQG